MFQPNPPAPRAMPDAELNEKIAQLQLQPEGLVAAMALIEEQSRLRQEDALELSKWQLQSQMRAATEAPAKNDFQDPAVLPPQQAAAETPSSAEPVIDIFAAVAPVSPAPPVSQSFPAATPAVPAEKIEDVVGALNATYAAVATNPEIKSAPEPVIKQEQALQEFFGLNSPESTEPAPVSSPVLVQETQASKDLSWEDQDSSQTEVTGPTRTSLAFSWSWLAISSTPLALVLAAVLKEAGASLAQSVILLATVLVLTSALGAVASVASARGSSSLTLVSRAAFGVWGNSFTATVTLLAKIFWAAALVYFVSRVVSPLIFNQPWFGSVAEQVIFPAEFTASMFVLIPLVIVAATVAALGGEVILRLQQVTAVVGVLGLGAFIFFVSSTYSLQDLSTGEGLATTSLLDLGIFVIALVTFTVLYTAGDFARKLPVDTLGSKVFFLSFVSSFFLPLISGVVGLLWLFMAGDTLGSSFSAEVLATVASSAPVWVFVVFVVALGISMLHLIAGSLYSLSGNLIGIGRVPGWVATLVMTLVVLAAVLVPSYLVALSTLQESIAELILIVGVVAAAWAGIFVSDSLARTRGYHEVSLTREYGFYGRFNFGNTIGFLLATALGFGYLESAPQLSPWTGYLGNLTPEIFEIAGSSIGIAMAFGLAALFPVVFGIPKIRKQERNLAQLDQRRQELKEFLDAAQ